MQWRNLPWATKLTIVLVASAIVPLTLVTLYNRSASRHELLTAARANDLQRAHGTAEVLDTYITNLQADLRMAAISPVLVSLMGMPGDRDARAEMTGTLNDMKEVQGFDEVFVVDHTGGVIASTARRLLGRNVASHRSVLSAVAGTTTVDDPSFDRQTGKHYLHVSSPVRRPHGPLVGVIVAAIDVTTLDRYVATDTNFGGTGEFGILWNDEGIRLVDPVNPSLRFKPFAELSPYSALLAERRFGVARESSREPRHDQRDLVERTKWLLYEPGDNPYLRVELEGLGPAQAALVPLKTKRWIYGIFTREERINAALEAQTRRGLLVAFVVGCVAIAIAMGAAGWVGRPLREIGRAANAIAAGDMTRRVGLTQRDEIGALGAAFDRMADALAAKDAQLHNRAGELERRVEQRTADLAFIARASSILASSLDLEATLTSVAELAVPALADSCVIDLLNDAGELRAARVVHASAEKQANLEAMRRDYPPGPEHPATIVTRTGKPLLIERVDPALLERTARDPSHLARLKAVSAESAMIVPLVVSGGAMGAITLMRASPGRPYTESDMALAEDLAGRCALAVDHARLYRQAQDANRLKDEFLSTVSHELRTPLNAMLGWARMLRTQSLDERRAARAIETIERNAQVQAQLIDDLLDVSRIITGKLPLDIRSVNLATVIESAVDATRPAADAKHIRIDTEVSREADSFLGDPNRLQQIVWNLLSNAIKFTPPGGLVHVRLRRTDDAVEVEVADTGAGIEREFLPYVFDRFRQADSTTTRVHGGLGLGLAIVRHLVELHGGTVEARSAGAGQGSAFTVRLPAARAVRGDEGSPRPPAREAVLDARALHGAAVLVVDDHAESRELAMAILERHGARVEVASTAREAFETLKRTSIDVIVADLGMPEEDGYSLLERVRQDPEPGLRHIPAIALTAYASDGDRRRTAEAGFAQHLAKPVEPSDLARAVVSALQMSTRVRSFSSRPS